MKGLAAAAAAAAATQRGRRRKGGGVAEGPGRSFEGRGGMEQEEDGEGVAEVGGRAGGRRARRPGMAVSVTKAETRRLALECFPCGARDGRGKTLKCLDNDKRFIVFFIFLVWVL